MKTILMLAPSLLVFAALPAWAQTPATPAASAVNQGEVMAYPPSFFTSYSPSTAGDMVSRIPGFSLDEGEEVRGLSGAQGNVLIDGDRPPGKSSLRDTLSRLPASQVARIDLIRGGAPGIDMQGKPVVINIIRVQERGGFSGAVELGTEYVVDVDRSDGSLDLTGTYEHASGARFEGQFGYNRASGESGLPGSRIRTNPAGVVTRSSSSRDNEEFKMLSGALGAEFEIFGGDLSLTAEMSRREDAEQGIETFTAGAPRLSDDAGENTEGAFGARYGQDLGSRASLETIFSKSWGESTNTSNSLRAGVPSQDIGEEQAGETALRTTLRFEPSQALKFEAGAEAAYNFLEGSSTIIIGGVSSPDSQAEVSEKRAEGFLVSTWRAQPSLTVEAALRYEVSTLKSPGQSKRLNFAKPSLQATWQISPERQLQTRIERVVDQLDFGDFLSSADLAEERVLVGAVDLTPTQSWVASVQYDQQFWDSGAFQLRLEHYWLKEVIDRIPIIIACPPPELQCPGEATGNIGDGKQARLSAQIDLPLDRFRIPGGRLTLEGDVLLRSEVTDPFTRQPRRFSGDLDYSYAVSFEQDIESWNTSWGFELELEADELEFSGDSREVSSQDPDVSAFVAYRPTRADTFRVEVQNVLPGRSDSRRTVFDGIRDASPVDFIETRRNEWAKSVSLTYRRAFD